MFRALELCGTAGWPHWRLSATCNRRPAGGSHQAFVLHGVRRCSLFFLLNWPKMFGERRARALLSSCAGDRIPGRRGNCLREVWRAGWLNHSSTIFREAAIEMAVCGDSRRWRIARAWCLFGLIWFGWWQSKKNLKHDYWLSDYGAIVRTSQPRWPGCLLTENQPHSFSNSMVG